ncbi:hypothetical protein BHE74_00006095 [Ensete ventricosum]|nr:hypothetical protein BHE74_00006095 [Ensete ventricosum]
MQQEVGCPSNGDRLGYSITSPSFVSPDRRSRSPVYLKGGGDLPYTYPVFSAEDSLALLTPPLPASGCVSISPSSVPFDEVEAAAASATENRLYLARLALHYQEMTEDYDLCLSHLRDAAEEVESLRRENASLRAANVELTRRLGLLARKHGGRVTPAAAAALADEFRGLSVAEPPPAEESPTSVLAFQESVSGCQFTRTPVVEKRVSLPKSISIRSSGYLKLNPGGGATSAANPNGRFRLSNPVMIGSVCIRFPHASSCNLIFCLLPKKQQRVSVGGGSTKKKGERSRGEDKEEEGEEGGGGAMGVEVYHQGMLKTELCNKWEESGECPYSDHCQFAHGIAELRPVLRHPRYKTELCRMVVSGGTCPYGHRCHFRHSISPSDHQRILLRPQ